MSNPTPSGEAELMPTPAQRSSVGVPATRERQELAIAGEDPIGLFKLAIESKAGADTLERVMAVRRELRAERAQEAFESALSDFQSECPVIVKTVSVPTKDGREAYKFAPLEEVESVIRPLEKKLGFNHTFDTDTASAPGWVIAKCIITHRAGHSRTSTIKLPLGNKTAIMSDTQVYAGALTFANRRCLTNAYGLVIAGEDKDGAGPKKKQPPEDQQVKILVGQLWALCKPIRGDEKNWDKINQFLFRHEILDGANPTDVAPHLTAERLTQVIAKVREHPEIAGAKQ